MLHNLSSDALTVFIPSALHHYATLHFPSPVWFPIMFIILQS